MEYIDLKKQYLAYKEEIDKEIIKCATNADFILGSQVKRFEQDLSQYIGVKYAVGCGNGTDALQMVYMAYGIGKGDAVFCPDMTFIASIEPACMLGATPVFVDIDSDTFNISIDSLKRQIANVLSEGKLRPRAVVAVDFLGNPADYDSLTAVCKQYDLLLIEDAAQGTGASYKGIRCGALGDVGTTSFFPSKPLGGYGDGGAVYTDDDEIYELLTSIRVHGKGKTKYDNVRIGMNSRLDTIQAAVLDVKLKNLQNEIDKRQKLAKYYVDRLGDIVKLQHVNKDCVSSYAQFVICLSDKQERDEMKAYLDEKSIPSLVYYPNALHNLPVFKNVNTYCENLHNSENYGNCNLGIPFSAFITEEEQNMITDAIKDFWR